MFGASKHGCFFLFKKQVTKCDFKTKKEQAPVHYKPYEFHQNKLFWGNNDLLILDNERGEEQYKLHTILFSSSWWWWRWLMINKMMMLIMMKMIVMMRKMMMLKMIAVMMMTNFSLHVFTYVQITFSKILEKYDGAMIRSPNCNAVP